MAKSRRVTPRGISLGSAIKKLRLDRNMSQDSLALDAEISQGYLSLLESGEIEDPRARVFFNLSEALNIDVSVLFEAAGYQMRSSLSTNEKLGYK